MLKKGREGRKKLFLFRENQELTSALYEAMYQLYVISK